MNDLFSLKNRVALCTGTTSGIGRHVAQLYASLGAKVVAVGRREKNLQELCSEINDLGGEAAYIVANLQHKEGVKEFALQSKEFFGTPSILFHAAGVNYREMYQDVTYESWDDTLNLNLALPFFLSREYVEDMKHNQYGKIITVASLQSYRAFANSIPYGASKGGVVQLTRAMAEAWSKYGITVNSIAPGFFKTELTEAVYKQPELLQHNADMTAIGRNGELRDLDGAAVFLASSASDYITGQIINVDGGFTAK